MCESTPAEVAVTYNVFSSNMYNYEEMHNYVSALIST